MIWKVKGKVQDHNNNTAKNPLLSRPLSRRRAAPVPIGNGAVLGAGAATMREAEGWRHNAIGWEF